MKYWRGYVVAAIFAAISAALVAFAKAHSTLIDMVYPYMTRIVISSLADWSGGVSFCVWDALVALGLALAAVTVILIIVLHWNPFQLTGWALAVVMFFSMCSTLLYGLNDYTGPLAEDVRLNVTEYTVSELNEATTFFRNEANKLANSLERDSKDRILGSFEDLAALASQGFQKLTYDKAISIVASVDAPVKKLPLAGLFTSRGDSGLTVSLTGESAVNPNVPAAALPYAMCKELSHRISIYSEADANFAAFLACMNNEDPRYQYAGYLMAYYYCYEAIASIPTSTAQACAANTDKGVTPAMRKDLDAVFRFYGEAKSSANVQAQANITASDSEVTLISFSSYSDVADLFASWYIQEYILPIYQEQNPVQEFDPLDESQVDLTGIVNAR